MELYQSMIEGKEPE